MNRIYFSFLVLLLASILQVKAQTFTNHSKGQTFTLLCEKVEDSNILGVFTYIKSVVIGKPYQFLTVTYFRGYEANIEYKYKFILEHPNGKIDKSDVLKMYQNKTLHKHSQYWKDVVFEEKGTYKIKVYLNDILQEVMTFEVKD